MKNRKVTKTMVKRIIDRIDDFYGILLTETQVLYILVNDVLIREEWNRAGEIDTLFREKFLSALVRYVGIKDKDWPTGASSPRYSRTFREEFAVKAVKKGIVFTESM